MKSDNDQEVEITIEDRITSLRAITFSVLLYVTGYAFKLSVLLFDVLKGIIANDYLRIVTSSLTGVALATGLLIVSVNERRKAIPYIIAIMDALALLLVFNIFQSKNSAEMSIAIFISLFMAFVGYHLIDTFSAKYKSEKSQPLADDRLTEANESLLEVKDSLEKYKKALTCKCGIEHTTVSRFRNCKQCRGTNKKSD